MLTNVRMVWLRTRWEIVRLTGRVVRSYGWGSIAAIAIVIAALGMQLCALQVSSQAEKLRSTLSNKLRSSHNQPRPIELNDVQRVAALEALLPASERIPEIVQQLIALAGRENLVLGSGEYRVQNQRAGTLSYHIRFPIIGNAAAIQQFVVGAMNEHRTLALESLSMHRENVAAADVEANVQFVLLAATRANVQQAAGLPMPGDET